MRKIKYYCDKCERRFTKDEGAIITSAIAVNGAASEKKTTDLCYECYEQFVSKYNAWLNESKEEVVHNINSKEDESKDTEIYNGDSDYTDVENRPTVIPIGNSESYPNGIDVCVKDGQASSDEQENAKEVEGKATTEDEKEINEQENNGLASSDEEENKKGPELPLGYDPLSCLLRDYHNGESYEDMASKYRKTIRGIKQIITKNLIKYRYVSEDEKSTQLNSYDDEEAKDGRGRIKRIDVGRVIALLRAKWKIHDIARECSIEDVDVARIILCNQERL